MGVSGAEAIAAAGDRATWVACETCDWLCNVPPLGKRERAACPRCGTSIARHRPDAIANTLAIACAALVLFVGTQTANFMSFELDGRLQDARIATGIAALFRAGEWPLAALIATTAVLAPLVWIASLLYAAGPLWWDRRPPQIAGALRCCQLAQDWSMLEVLLLAVLVTYVKLVAVANVALGPGAWLFGPLILTLEAARTSFDRRAFWSRVEVLR